MCKYCRKGRAYLEPLSHLKLILIREIFHQSGDLQTFSLAFLEQLEGNHLQTVFDSIGDFAGVRSRNFSDRICLPDDKEIFDLPYVVLGVPLNCALDNKEVCGVRLSCHEQLCKYTMYEVSYPCNIPFLLAFRFTL